MSTPLRRVLLGTPQPVTPRLLWPLVGLTALAVSAVGYASGLVTVSGGVVWLPAFAAWIGALGAAVVGYCRGGALAGWAVTAAALVGHHVSRAVSVDSLGERVAFLFRPDALGWYAAMALLVGVGPFVLGSALRWGADALRGAPGHTARE
ncbi:hypothetical protein ACFQL1_23050 [Halomicroarcula sp. GCM10025709]|uniref:hypothetical protein n=1 Tax=Haloarcula TaxID=2237 RepID=UPI0024C281EA|nr:hypothetical protein [Halomicroarcula sp. YJ-61-S]